jgi:hypothetical protein
MTDRFALLSYATNNLGDEIQSIAARQFLPSVDLLVERDSWAPSSPNPVGTHKLIMNGWFTHSPEKWPPPGFLQPLLTSMHITREKFLPTTLVPAAEALSSAENIAYLRKHGPVGGRDEWTVSYLRSNGVEAYFSGCVTLTLGDGLDRRRGDYVCAVDLPALISEKLSHQAKTSIVKLSHRDPSGGSFQERSMRAERLLSLYAHAKYVVTTRLHCAMPCLAFGTPVLFITAASDRYRFSGLVELMRHCTADAFLAGNVSFDFDAPTANDPRYQKWRVAMIDRLEAFTSSRIAPFEPTPLDRLKRIAAG